MKIRFVLVRPRNALNIGAVARAMANFGIGDLFLVSPVAGRWRSARSARYGSKLLENARSGTIQEALSGCRLVLGTASVDDRAQRREHVSLPKIRHWIEKNSNRNERVAVLFGTERDGLDNESLSFCSAVLTIPTAAQAPSMNLGQAAALTAYELTRPLLKTESSEPAIKSPDANRIAALVDASIIAMKKARMNLHVSPRATKIRTREGFLRWKMSEADASWLTGLLKRLSQKHSA